MCRILFNPSPLTTGYVGLEEQMSLLQASAGGDGNGLGLLQSGDIVKGVKVTVDDLAAAALDGDQPFLFHTRRASIGERVDSLCQPFRVELDVKGPPTIVAHNGTWENYRLGVDYLLRQKDLRYLPFNLSDSLVATMMSRYLGPSVFRHYVGSGVWIHARKYSNLRVIAVVETGDFALNFTTGEAASEPVGWAKSDSIYYANPGSVFELYPDMKLLGGEMLAKPPKKGGKK